jgi:hypothetical protein
MTPADGGDDHRPGAESRGDACGVHRAGAAEGEQRETGRIMTALGSVDPGGAGHVLIDQAEDAPCGRGALEADGRADVFIDRPRCSGGVEPHLSAEEEPRIEVAQQQVCVGDGRPVASEPIARRAGIGTGRFRTDGEQAQGVDTRDGAAAHADLDHVDGRRLDRQPGPLDEALRPRDLELVGHERPAVLDQAELGGRPAHVERHQVPMAGLGAETGRCKGTGGRP